MGSPAFGSDDRNTDIDYTLALRGGGYLTLQVDAVLAQLTDEERAFILELLGQVHTYALQAFGATVSGDVQAGRPRAR
jgi:hypothetical protein